MTTTIDLEVSPLAVAGAVVTGFRPDAMDDDIHHDAINAALARYGVLFFPGFDTDPGAFKSVGEYFGDLELGHAKLPTLSDVGFPEIGVLSTAVGNTYESGTWHNDESWLPAPAKMTVFQMQETPAVGGDTMWASQIRAFELLSDRLKNFLRPLTARHRNPNTPSLYADHPLVVVNEITGAESLFVNEKFTSEILDLEPAESRMLLDFFKAHSTHPALTCRRKWSVGEVAVWDNHFVQHLALQDYGDSARRVHRMNIARVAPRGWTGP